MSSGIYKIERIATGQMYVGSAVKFAVRWRIHRSDLKLQRHHNPGLQRAWNKYGPKAFAFTVLLICDKANLLFFEQRALDRLKPVYNANPTAGSNLGKTLGEDTRAKIRLARSRQVCSAETRALLSRIRTGKKRSPETCAKMRAFWKGKKRNWPEESVIRHARAMSLALKGRVVSIETRAKISAANSGKQRTDAQRATIKAARAAWFALHPPVKKSSKFSDDGRRNMSLSALARFKTNPPPRDALGRIVATATSGAPH